MEKAKYANIALLLAIISLIGPLLCVLAFMEIIPREGAFGVFIVSGMALLTIIIGALGWNETEQKWKPILAFIIAIGGMIITYALGYPIIMDIIYDLIPPPP
ncbi:MAG: hypothetical protein JXA99_06740 [Candidatus Lokiarchaeota archaeon]|nr:hypothetical protein [Candidatus Lokiarchaeota archaeon]